MVSKVKCRELEDVRQKTYQYKEKFDEYINSCLSGMSLISDSWHGDDATYSIAKIKRYLNELKKISISYENIGNFISYANREYYEKDNSFQSKFTKERQDYESEYSDV